LYKGSLQIYTYQYVYVGSVKDVMLLKITSPTARNDASARLCEVWNKPKQSLVGSRI
jgi:hypothetical protein